MCFHLRAYAAQSYLKWHLTADNTVSCHVGWIRKRKLVKLVSLMPDEAGDDSDLIE